MRLRLGDVSGQVINSGVQYFPPFSLGRNEVFVDCGAFDGDTIAQFRRATDDHFDQIIAFEPDPVNFAALKSAHQRRSTNHTAPICDRFAARNRSFHYGRHKLPDLVSRNLRSANRYAR